MTRFGGGALALLFAPVATWALWQAGRRAERIKNA